MRLSYLVVLLGLLVTGCVTPYQPNGFMGGFTETQLDENVFRVSFRGNANTGKERVDDFTLLRSAELSLKNGFSYFAIIDEKDYTSRTSYTEASTSTTTGSAYGSGNRLNIDATTRTTGGGTYEVVKPGSSNTIVCFKEKPANLFTYNATIAYKSLVEKYGIKNK